MPANLSIENTVQYCKLSLTLEVTKNYCFIEPATPEEGPACQFRLDSIEADLHKEKNLSQRSFKLMLAAQKIRGERGEFHDPIEDHW